MWHEENFREVEKKMDVPLTSGSHDYEDNKYEDFEFARFLCSLHNFLKCIPNGYRGCLFGDSTRVALQHEYLFGDSTRVALQHEYV